MKIYGKLIIIVFILLFFILYVRTSLAEIQPIIDEVYQTEGGCFQKTNLLKDRLYSEDIKCEGITCQINICQNKEPDKVFWSDKYGEMGYYYEGNWYSEKDCLKGHTINRFYIGIIPFYADTTISSNVSLSKEVHWKCFIY